ncbi:hypothetical protein NH286_05680 [Anaerococcus sp. NML200574]|uniref:Uncharacterized protein n=1 Tax=Anaerococcus kampingae TaxID=3115614 RepID=A0ABW9MB05_9FIRM|nr:MULTISPECIES: hypothetical protein [unclassified Anaerococcus]MCW6678645.1 hypothetical protein [Anaerococcus sp. NML200574]MCW6700728.1 hypothetical protein [Anaerococcus sp. NML200537]
MEKYELLEKKKEELRILQEKINEGPQNSFLKTFLGPLGLAFLGLSLAIFLKMTDVQKIGIFIIIFIISLSIYTLRTQKKNEREKKRQIAERLALQKEIVSLSREIKNENN